MGNTRFDSIAGEVYPSSGNIDETIKLLVENGFSGYCSPLHNPDDFDKEPHYHIQVIRPIRKGLSLATWRDVAQVCKFANGFVKILDYPHSYAQYLLHLNHPEKEQFEESVREFGDIIPYKEYIKVNDFKRKVSDEQSNYLKDIFQFCLEAGITNYASLVNICLVDKEEWLSTVTKNTTPIIAYMRSLEYAWGGKRKGTIRDNISDKVERRVVELFTKEENPHIIEDDIYVRDLLVNDGVMIL